MPLRYLLDTNTCSYIIKGNRPQVRERLLEVPMTEVGISTVTEAELRFGVARLPQAKKLAAAVEEFLLRLERLPWNSEAARHYARLRSTLEREGEPMGNLDMMIAAQALAVEAVLVTSDRVFRRVKGLNIEDWSGE
jgi:tRNA(fMet)-specific endonuclease VapC